MISETRRFAFSNVLMLISLGMLVFTFTATHGTDCARAAGGSCAVGDTEVFGNDINVGGDLEFEGTSVDDFETKITATNPTADRTITLPDASGTLALAGGGAATVAEGGTGVTTLAANGLLVGDGTNSVNVTAAGNAGEVLTSNGAGSDPTFQSAAAAAYIDMWDITWSSLNDQSPIQYGWAQKNDTGFSAVGSPMVHEGSGIFKFPATGVWSVRYYMTVYGNGTTDAEAQGYIYLTADNGAVWDKSSICYANLYTGTAYDTCTAETLFYVQDVEDYHVKFVASSITGLHNVGNANQTETGFVAQWIGNP